MKINPCTDIPFNKPTIRSYIFGHKDCTKTIYIYQGPSQTYEVAKRLNHDGEEKENYQSQKCFKIIIMD